VGVGVASLHRRSVAARPKRFRVLLGAMVIAAIGGAAWGNPAPQPPSEQDSLILYENLLANSNDVAANLAYARALEAEGRVEEARQIYRKILALSPDNTEAATALASVTQPSAQTNYTFRTGGAIETNSARRDSTFSPFFDTLGFAEFTVNDLRQIGGLKIQSNIDIFTNVHNRYSPGNISDFLINSGPVWDLSGHGTLRTAIGGEYVLQGQSPIGNRPPREFEFDAGNFIFNYVPPGNRALQSVNLIVGYNNFRPSESFRSGPFVVMTAPFLISNVLPFSSLLLATPGYVLNGAQQSTTEPQATNYNEANLELITFTPLVENRLGSGRVVGIVGVFLAGDLYESPSPGQSGNRRDMLVIPRIGLRLEKFAHTPLQVDLDYRYERNFSNEFAEGYQDNIFSLTFTYHF
jgi:tetratricopeptide (TPR) repeat protein